MEKYPWQNLQNYNFIFSPYLRNMRQYVTPIIFFATALCCCTKLLGQAYKNSPKPPSYSIVNHPGTTLEQVIAAMDTLADHSDTAEGGEVSAMSSFRNFWQGRVLANDSSGLNMFQQYYKGLRTSMLAGRGTCTGNWTCIGPTSLPKQIVGYVNALWTDPNDSNYILAGTPGGLFKTTTGGTTWTCITDNAPLAGGAMGVNNIAVNPLNINHIYLGTYGASILKSFDGGSSWQQEFIPIDSDYNDTIKSIFIHLTEDNSQLYALCGKKIFTRSTLGSTWTNITPTQTLPVDDSILLWNDFKFVPGHPTHFFASGMYKHTYIRRKDTLYQAPTGFIWEATTAVPGIGGWTNVSVSLLDSLDIFTPAPSGIHYLHDTDCLCLR